MHYSLVGGNSPEFEFLPSSADCAPLYDVGEPVEKIAQLNFSKPSKEGSRRASEQIIHISRFGALVTNIHISFLEGATVKHVEVGGFPIGPLSETYSDVEPGTPLALYGSAGYLEIAYNNDHADKPLNMGIGIIVNIDTKPDGA